MAAEIPVANAREESERPQTSSTHEATAGPQLRRGPRLGKIRGVVVDGVPTTARLAGGVRLGRVLVIGAVAITVGLRARALGVLATEAFLSALPVVILPILAVVLVGAIVGRLARPLGGCLLAPLNWLAATVTAARFRGAAEPASWDLTIDTDSGAVSVRVAGDYPWEGGEEIEVLGFGYGGRTHAWWIHGIEPVFVRLGRGVPGLLASFVLATGAIIAVLALTGADGPN